MKKSILVSDNISVVVDDIRFGMVGDYDLEVNEAGTELSFEVDFLHSDVEDLEEYMSEITTSVGSDDDFFISVLRGVTELTKEQIAHIELIPSSRVKEVLVYEDTFNLKKLIILNGKTRLFFVKTW